MATQQRKIRVASNPQKRRATSSRPSAATKKGHHMAKAAKKKNAAASGKKQRRTKRKNPATTRRTKRRHNPSGISAAIGSPKDLLTGATAGLVSALATRQIPQMILGADNAGPQGYLANAATALAAAWLAGTFMGAAAARGALIGGAVIVLDRVLAENVSPIGPFLSLSGVGDPTAFSKLGTVRDGYYSHPNLQNPDGSMYVPDPVIDQSVAAVVAKYPQLAAPVAAAVQGKMGAVNPSSLRRHSASGMMLSSRFAGRFNQ